MSMLDAQARTQSSPSGCFGALGIVCAWFIGVVALCGVAAAVGGGLVIPLGGLLFNLVPGGLAFGGTVCALHVPMLANGLPRTVRSSLIGATMLGAFLYWMTFWIFYNTLFNQDWLGLVSSLRASERDTPAEAWALLAIAGAGAIVGGTSCGILATLQWLVLRKYQTGNWRWAVPIVLAGAVIMALFLYGTFWFSHGSSWN